MIRKIIQIDEEKCNGCGACAEACHEGAIGMVNGRQNSCGTIIAMVWAIACPPAPPVRFPLWNGKLLPMTKRLCRKI